MAAFGWLAQPAVLPWVALALGLCIGSFLNVVIHRLPKVLDREWLSDLPSIIEESTTLKNNDEARRIAGELRTFLKGKLDKSYGLVRPRSRCPQCGHQITALENIPVLSYIALRGKCSQCAAAIGLRYPIVELLAGVAA